MKRLTLLCVSAAGLALGEKIAEEDQLAVSSIHIVTTYVYCIHMELFSQTRNTNL